MRWHAMLVLCGLCFGGWGNAHTAEPALFRVRAEVIEALEGGPVLIKATLSYHGTKTIRIYQTFFPNAQTECPKGWTWVLKAHREEIHNGKLGGYVDLAPGVERSEVLVLHYNHVVPAGKVKLKVTWPVDVNDEHGRPISYPSTLLMADVLPASSKNLQALRNRLTKRIRQPELSEVNPYRLADMVLFTKHRALLPSAFEMLESGNADYPVYKLARHIYALSPSPGEVHARMVNLVRLLSWKKGKLPLFWYWQSRKITLPEKEMKKLTNDPDVWVRVLTYEAFGKQCADAWIHSLLAELRMVTEPLPRGQFARLLAELDDDHFQIRESATAKLLGLALRVENQLKHCKQAVLSPEAARRVEKVLALIAERRPDSPPFLVLNELDTETSEGQAILRALSEGDPDNWLTKEAKVLLSPNPQSPRLKEKEGREKGVRNEWR